MSSACLNAERKRRIGDEQYAQDCVHVERAKVLNMARESFHVLAENARARLVRRELDHEHKVGRVTRGGERACARERLVRGTRVYALRWRLAVHLRAQPDHWEGRVQLLGLRLGEHLLLRVPAGTLEKEAVNVAAVGRALR
eukprot:6181761-Pleurochrysis_carterae.AAC.2